MSHCLLDTKEPKKQACHLGLTITVLMQIRKERNVFIYIYVRQRTIFVRVLCLNFYCFPCYFNVMFSVILINHKLVQKKEIILSLSIFLSLHYKAKDISLSKDNRILMTVPLSYYRLLATKQLTTIIL